MSTVIHLVLSAPGCMIATSANRVAAMVLSHVSPFVAKKAANGY